MKFAIVSKGDKRSNNIKAMMKKHLIEFDLEYNKENPDLVISVGGDGTFLEAFHRYQQCLSSTAFIGVHTGHLGFYADWVPEEVEKLILEIAKTPYDIVEYPLLDITIQGKNGQKNQNFLALNEATIKTAEGSVVFDVEIRGDYFETFRGDGLCVSTPSGSTAYNKALGGGIIHPSLEALQLTEMARSEEHTSELQSRGHLVCRLVLEKKKKRALSRPAADRVVGAAGAAEMHG